MPLCAMQQDYNSLKHIIQKQELQEQKIHKLQNTSKALSGDRRKYIKALLLLSREIKTQSQLQKEQTEELKKQLLFLKCENNVLNQLVFHLASQLKYKERTGSLPVSSRGKKERSPVLLFTQPTSSGSSGNSSTEGSSDARLSDLSDKPELKMSLLKQSTIEDLTPLSSAVGTPREKKVSRQKKGKKKGKKKKKKTIKISPKSV